MAGRLDEREGRQGSFTRPGTEGKRTVGSSFYRGESLNFNPEQDEYRKDGFLEEFILKGWLPHQRPIAKGTKITAFGSCFAENITKHLSEIGFDLARERDPDIYISAMGEGMVNTQALLGQFEWALLDKRLPENLWHGFKAEGYGYDENIRQRTRKVFLETGFFIITLGLSEVWYDEPTGGVFWRAVPLNSFDASRHKFRVTSFAETKANLQSMYDIVRAHVPHAQVLFTLSPIPLAATFRPASCMTANSASKAILRAALDEMLRENAADLNERLFYFPSYEIAQELFPKRFQEDGRHPSPAILSTIMKIFESAYCANETTLADANEKFQRARARNIEQLASGSDDDDATSRSAARKDRRAARRNTRNSQGGLE